MTGRIYGFGKSAWTDDRIARAKKLSEEGLSFRAIADDLGGVTRNAVIGKLGRLGIKKKCLVQPRRRTSPIPKAQRNGGAALFSIRARAADKSRKTVAPKRPVDFDELPSNEATSLPAESQRNIVSLFDLRDHHCRWPISDHTDKTIGFCGRDRADDKVSYCVHHCRRAFAQA